jgi:hypothetical protein
LLQRQVYDARALAMADTYVVAVTVRKGSAAVYETGNGQSWERHDGFVEIMNFDKKIDRILAAAAKSSQTPKLIEQNQKTASNEVDG